MACRTDKKIRGQFSAVADRGGIGLSGYAVIWAVSTLRVVYRLKIAVIAPNDHAERLSFLQETAHGRAAGSS